MRLWYTQLLQNIGGDRSASMESNLAQPGIYSARRKASILMRGSGERHNTKSAL